MDKELAIALLNNISLMITLNIVCTFLPSTNSHNKFQPITQGLLAGSICIIIMLSPIQIVPGVILDTRSIVITLTSAFLGGIPVLIAILMTTIFRIYQGGAGTLTGIMVIVSSGGLGLIFHDYRLGHLKKNNLHRIVELYILGVIVHIIMLLCFFMINDNALKILKDIYVPVILLYPIGTVLLGLLFFKQRDNMAKNTKLDLALQKLLAIKDRLDRSQAIAHVGSWELDLATEQVWASKEAFAIYGMHQASPYVNLAKIQQFVDKQDRSKLDQALQKLLECNDEYDIEFTITSNDGERKNIHSKASLSYDKQHQPVKVLGIISDITQNKAKEQELIYMHYHDQLTGLYNRGFYEEELHRLDVARNYPLTIIIGDVNGLKLINDSFGHDKGDEMLIKITAILSLCCCNDEFIARLGGDEFSILLPSTDKTETESIINRIVSKLSQETIDNINLSVSFGYATKNDSKVNIDKIFQAAEDNMVKVKMMEAPSRRNKTIEAFKTTLFEKDIKSEQHSERVAEYATKLAKAYKMNAAAIAEIKTAGLLHDIGKIMIPDNILNKSGMLDRSEWMEIKKHSTSGYRILLSLGGMDKIAEYILAHHERIDGKGYPNGVQGENIPIQAKIISIADSYDAMSSARSYKKPLPKAEIIAELKNNSGTQFDPVLVDIFIKEILQ